MPRHRSRGFDGDSILGDMFRLLRHAPWWCGPPVILAAYLLFAFAIPACLSLVHSSPNAIAIGPLFTGMARQFAPWAAFLTLILWLVALLAKWRDRARLDRQRGIETIRELPWQEFEHLLAEAFRRQGYEARVAAPGPDGGVDIVLRRGGEEVLVQCKQWKAWKVGVKPVRELMGVVASEDAAGGIFVTSGEYTADARRFAEGNPLRLIDGDELEHLITSVQRGSAAADRGRTPPRPAPAAPEPIAAPAGTPSCPACGAAMVKRVARKGPLAGAPFWGCSTYPHCRGIRSGAAVGAR